METPHDNNIKLDFILICETFLHDSNTYHYELPGYSFVYKNRSTMSRVNYAFILMNQYNLNYVMTLLFLLKVNLSQYLSKLTDHDDIILTLLVNIAR